MQFNWYMLFITALVPLVTGFIWYNPKVFGNAWLKSINATSESMQGGNMALIFGLTYLFGLMLSTMMMPLTIHQMHIGSIFANDTTLKDPNSETSLFIKQFMDAHGKDFRTFKHGMFHGVLSVIFYVLPALGILSLFEKRGFKYVFIHVGYFALTIGIMGGLICQFL